VVVSIVEDARAPPNPKLMRQVVYGLTVLGAALGILAEFVTSPVVAAAALVVGPLSLALALSAPDLFEVVSRRGARGFNFLIVAPALTLMFTGFAVKLVTYEVPLIAAAAGFVVGGAAGAIGMRRPGLLAPMQLLFFTAMFGACYAFGAAVIADTRFDAAPAQAIRTTVTDTYSTHGRSTSYYLRLPAWGPRTGPNEVSVSYSLYRALGAGDDVCIQLHPGLLGAAWFTIDRCAGPANSAGPGDGVMAPIQIPDLTNGLTAEPSPPSPPPGAAR
jgi:hypothetical protein